jgi:hypothetical protein
VNSQTFGVYKPPKGLAEDLAKLPIIPPAVARFYCANCGLLMSVKPDLILLMSVVNERFGSGVQINGHRTVWTKNYILGRGCFQCMSNPTHFEVTAYSS